MVKHTSRFYNTIDLPKISKYWLYETQNEHQNWLAFSSCGFYNALQDMFCLPQSAWLWKLHSHLIYCLRWQIFRAYRECWGSHRYLPLPISSQQRPRISQEKKVTARTFSWQPEYRTLQLFSSQRDLRQLPGHPPAVQRTCHLRQELQPWNPYSSRLFSCLLIEQKWLICFVPLPLVGLNMISHGAKSWGLEAFSLSPSTWKFFFE